MSGNRRTDYLSAEEYSHPFSDNIENIVKSVVRRNENPKEFPAVIGLFLYLRGLKNGAADIIRYSVIVFP
ncbi:hypothetical protein NECAME_00406 [Necator americanus]|uniref:Uncharacterized protein n=1 Tax=Necator americanus TaxID=51031 RepID=W2TBQ2_NECAM|nr:hypothetical protein NECAME_00406 [Necator americanus]ETN79029.1 hypothetical protein NECAME_00406 [Necator americanus]